MESTLADTYRDVIGSVGFERGWGRGADNGDEEWDEHKLVTLKMLVKEGLRQFYHPPPDNSGVSHQWSFMTPRVRLTLEDGERAVRMPFDFHGVVGGIHVVDDDAITADIKLTGRVRAHYSLYPDQTGKPRYAELEPLPPQGKEIGQRWQLVFWPEADDDYTLEFCYKVAGSMLSGDLPYAYGGATHSSTIVASCLAVGENLLDDIDQGPRYKRWRERLAASISIDRHLKADNLGPNLDRSDLRGVPSFRGGYSWPRLRYNGVLYD